MNPLRVEDFVKVPAKAKFDPYQKTDGHGFFSDYRISARTFDIPGTYRIKFTYSTEVEDIKDWLGDGRWRWKKDGRDTKLEELFDKVPKLTVNSNEITIAIIEH